MLDLIAGKLESVRLVMRPSREVALEQTFFDRYWSGTLDVTVPVRADSQ